MIPRNAITLLQQIHNSSSGRILFFSFLLRLVQYKQYNLFQIARAKTSINHLMPSDSIGFDKKAIIFEYNDVL